LPHPSRLACLGVALLGLAAWPAQAWAGCVWSDLIGEGARAAVVKLGPKKVNFLTDAALRPGCPQAGAACTLPSYVLPGDVVLLGHAEGAFTCAGFQNARGVATIDFLPTSAVAALPANQQASDDWAGHWTAPEQDITISAAAGGALKVSGEATWGDGDPARRLNGGVHTGEVEGVAKPVNGVLAFTQGETTTLPYSAGEEYDCRVRMIRRGPFLLVEDNNSCGGLNVSFSGFYRRGK
jgi:hypothetical protein